MKKTLFALFLGLTFVVSPVSAAEPVTLTQEDKAELIASINAQIQALLLQLIASLQAELGDQNKVLSNIEDSVKRVETKVNEEENFGSFEEVEEVLSEAEEAGAKLGLYRNKDRTQVTLLYRTTGNPDLKVTPPASQVYEKSETSCSAAYPYGKDKRDICVINTDYAAPNDTGEFLDTDFVFEVEAFGEDYTVTVGPDGASNDRVTVFDYGTK